MMQTDTGYVQFLLVKGADLRGGRRPQVKAGLEANLLGRQGYIGGRQWVWLHNTPILKFHCSKA